MIGARAARVTQRGESSRIPQSRPVQQHPESWRVHQWLRLAVKVNKVLSWCEMTNRIKMVIPVFEGSGKQDSCLDDVFPLRSPMEESTLGGTLSIRVGDSVHRHASGTSIQSDSNVISHVGNHGAREWQQHVPKLEEIRNLGISGGRTYKCNYVHDAWPELGQTGNEYLDGGFELTTPGNECIGAGIAGIRDIGLEDTSMSEEEM
eukprot:3236624-Amphidinium_carterae.1